MTRLTRLLALFASVMWVISGCSNARLETQGKPRPPLDKLECGVKKLLTVYQDLDGNQVFGPQEMTGAVISFSSSLTAIENYGYANFSAHPLAGPEGEANKISVYFYSGPEGLSFNFFLDREATSVHANRADIAVTVKYNDHRDRVLLSDETGELQDVDADLESTFYRGLFDYRMTTDGGIIGPLVEPEFEVHFQTLDGGALNHLTVHSPRGASVESRKLGDKSLNFMVKYADVDPCVFP